jgi:hypothetical protein
LQGAFVALTRGAIVRGKMTMLRYSQWPNSTQIAELFEIKDRKIKEIFAVIVTQPYKAPTGWE